MAASVAHAWPDPFCRKVNFLDSHWPRQVTCSDPGQGLLEILAMVKKNFGQTRINFRPKKSCREKFFFEFLGESDDFVANYHRHLSENSDK